MLICVHVILGLPGEGYEEMMETAEFLAGLPVQGVKIHHCHVIRGTPLAELYLNGKYRPMTYPSYLMYVCDFLEYLPWPMTIQRLVGEAPENLLLAPHWDRPKAGILQDIQNEFAKRKTHQGSRRQQANILSQKNVGEGL